MSDALTPSVEGGTSSSPILTGAAWAHVGGTVAGGLLLAVVVLAAREALAPSGAVWWSLIVLALSAAIVEFLPEDRRWFPERKAQVPADWIRWNNRSKTAAAWGTILGVGVLTGLVTPVFYSVLLASLVQSSLIYAVIPPILYGAIRGLSILGVLQLRRWRPSLAPGHIEHFISGLLRRPASFSMIIALVLLAVTVIP